MKGKSKARKSKDLLKTTKETSKGAVIENLINSQSWSLSTRCQSLTQTYRKSFSIYTETIKIVSNIYHLRKVFQESINARSTWKNGRGKSSHYLCLSVRFWGSGDHQLNGCCCCYSWNCSVSMSRNAAISAATVKKSKSNKEVTTFVNCSDSCKGNHTDGTVDKVLHFISVLGTLCERKNRMGGALACFLFLSSVCVAGGSFYPKQKGSSTTNKPKAIPIDQNGSYTLTFSSTISEFHAENSKCLPVSVSLTPTFPNPCSFFHE